MLLQVIIDRKLNFKTHVTKLCEQVYLYRLKHTGIFIHMYEIDRFRALQRCSFKQVFIKCTANPGGVSVKNFIFCKDCANNFKISFFHILNLGATILQKRLSVAESVDYGLQPKFYFICKANIDGFIQPVRKRLPKGLQLHLVSVKIFINQVSNL